MQESTPALGVQLTCPFGDLLRRSVSKATCDTRLHEGLTYPAEGSNVICHQQGKPTRPEADRRCTLTSQARVEALCDGVKPS